jgi:tRNA threonylcarbamoyl adenosine modification protein (Sua5/YciO/YrdC/YwlC family)
MDERGKAIKMARIDISKGYEPENISSAVKAIRDGYVIVAPLENGYVLLADAFFHDAVRALHVLRGDSLGTAAQVLIPSPKTLQGIAREITEDITKLISAFWPGLLSLSVKPQRGLNWDLGDEQKLDQINVRVPSIGFVHSVLQESGPLAVASASVAGSPATIESGDIKFSENEVALIFDSGDILPTLPSTIVECDVNGLRVRRIGALGADQLTSVVPSISLP